MKSTLALASSLILLAGCTAATGTEEPTSNVSSAQPAPDTCNEARFAGTFDLPAAEHTGDTEYCEGQARAWNATERARTIRFARELDGSWSSFILEAPEAGKTTYALDATACALTATYATRVTERDASHTAVSVPLRSTTTVTLTTTGLSVDVADAYGNGYPIQGLPCTTSATTAATRL